MQNQNKDSIETFFKKGAQNYNIEFNEGDWQKLEALLDEEMPVAFSFWSLLRKFWPIPLLVLLIPAFWFTFSSLQHSGTPGGDPANTGEYAGKEPMDPSFPIPAAGDRTSDQSSQDYPDEHVSVRSPAESLTGSMVPARSPGGSRVEVEAEGSASNKPETLTGQYSSMGKSNMSEDKSLNAAGASRSVSLMESIPPEYGYALTGPAGDPTLQSIKPDPGSRSNLLSFYVGMGFSPDFSTVGLGNFIAPGFRWKLLTELRISRRWQISTGLVWVKNKYEAYGEDYHAPVRYWKNGIVADETYGECVMLDLPLNLRFNVLDKNRHQFFISGGASTYFLLKEDYYFQYEQDDPDLPDYWGTDEVSIYPFRIVNISVGYQYFFGRKGSVQVEPFIKLPTAGVGWGNVDLQTLGIYFMYKYQIGN